MADLKSLTQKVIAFRNARKWKQFHNPKDSALSLVLEAAEVMEHFQWKNKEEMDAYVKANRKAIGEELADTLYWVLLMAHDLKINLPKNFVEKLKKNGEKNPIKKSKGRHTKYTKL